MNLGIIPYPRIIPWDCIACGACEEACPHGAIKRTITGAAYHIDVEICLGSICEAECKDVCPVDAIMV